MAEKSSHVAWQDSRGRRGSSHACLMWLQPFVNNRGRGGELPNASRLRLDVSWSQDCHPTLTLSATARTD